MLIYNKPIKSLVPGKTGPTGRTGSTGEIGRTGYTGIFGRTGKTGAIGPPAGDKGRTGRTGKTGAIGPVGNPGVPGRTGKTGKTGFGGFDTPGADQTASGVTTTNTYDGNYLNVSKLSITGMICHLTIDGKYNLASARTVLEGTSKILLMSENSSSDLDVSRVFLEKGYYRNDAWSFVPGLPVYLDMHDSFFIGKGLTQNVPSEPSAIRRVIGWAYTDTIIFFDPSNDFTGGAQNGYIAGGITGTGLDSMIASVDRINFSTEITSSSTASNLSQARFAMAGFSDKKLYGYFINGSALSYTIVNTADRITYSTEVTAANTTSNGSSEKYGAIGLSDGYNHGYTAGGQTATMLQDTDKLVFSTGVNMLNTVSNLSQTKLDPASCSDGKVYGYFTAGSGEPGPVVTNQTDRIEFSTEVTSANSASDLYQERSNLVGVSDNLNYGYFMGGITAVGDRVTSADRITFSTGVSNVNTVSDLSVARDELAGCSDGGFHGYISGGRSGADIHVNFTDKIIFSTGVTSANTTSNLSLDVRGAVGIGDYSV